MPGGVITVHAFLMLHQIGKALFVTFFNQCIHFFFQFAVPDVFHQLLALNLRFYQGFPFRLRIKGRCALPFAHRFGQFTLAGFLLRCKTIVGHVLPCTRYRLTVLSYFGVVFHLLSLGVVFYLLRFTALFTLAGLPFRSTGIKDTVGFGLCTCSAARSVCHGVITVAGTLVFFPGALLRVRNNTFLGLHRNGVRRFFYLGLFSYRSGSRLNLGHIGHTVTRLGSVYLFVTVIVGGDKRMQSTVYCFVIIRNGNVVIRSIIIAHTHSSIGITAGITAHTVLVDVLLRYLTVFTVYIEHVFLDRHFYGV